jgi:UDPglucose 6-dehydrogenase
MRISVVGSGYVGLVSGACLAEKGHQVVCIDQDPAKVAQINLGLSPIHEAGLLPILQRQVGFGLTATTDLASAVLASDLTMIAVGTPFDGDRIDLSAVQQAAREIGAALRNKDGYNVVVVKSTVVPGTTEEVVLPLLEEASGKKAGIHFGVGMNPEFLREGEAVADFMNPDRIVLGGVDAATLAVMEALYGCFPDAEVVRTSPRTAEMIKYTANSLLATLISFANEIGNLCASLGGIDVVEVMHGVHLDKRFTPILPNSGRVIPSFTTYLAAGCGFGGSCFPKDVKALIAHGRQAGQPMPLLESVMATNEQQPYRILALLDRHFPDLRDVPVTVLGLAFKPGTDDMRESPAIPIVRELLVRGARVRAYDPVARLEAEKIFGMESITFCQTVSEALEGTEAVLLLTCWTEFSALPELFQQLPAQPLLVDGRRMLDRTLFDRYTGVGL